MPDASAPPHTPPDRVRVCWCAVCGRLGPAFETLDPVATCCKKEMTAVRYQLVRRLPPLPKVKAKPRALPSEPPTRPKSPEKTS